MTSESAQTPSDSTVPVTLDEGVCVSGSCGMSWRNWAWLGLGIVALSLGHLFLVMAGSHSVNFVGRLAPFLIIGGYSLFGCGLVPRRKK